MKLSRPHGLATFTLKRTRNDVRRLGEVDCESVSLLEFALSRNAEKV